MIARAVKATGAQAPVCRLTWRVFLSHRWTKLWCQAASLIFLCASLTPIVHAQSNDKSDAANAQHAKPAPPTPSPPGRAPASSTIEQPGDSHGENGTEDGEQTWAVDAYPEPEFDYDLIRSPPDRQAVAKSLRVVSWHLDDAVSAGLMARNVPPKKTWRHTFGAELRSRSSTQIDPASFDADIVLLQGVRDIREVRRLFPARSWKVVVSRQLLKSLDHVHTGRQRTLAKSGATAVAVRYQRGVRITAVRHLTQLTSQPSVETTLPDTTPTTSSADRKNVASTRDVSSAGTAVRIYAGGRVRWIANVAFSKLCRQRPSQCREFAALENWLKTTANTMKTSDLPILIGGQLPAGSPSQIDLWTWLTDAHEACAHQQITLSPMTKNLQSQVIDEAACIVAATLQ